MASSDHKSSRDAALDLLVYAPLGLALEARTLMPDLIQRGRNQVTMARMVGRFAVQQGQVEATRRLGPMQGQVESVLADLGLVPRPETTPQAAPRPAPEAEPAAAAEPEIEAPAVEDLAVTDYDSLAASQVVPRLRALSATELEDVRRYEASGRGRKTILNRIAQLQSR
ncbi:MAG: hypothetical protein ACR2JF_00265 [Iamia sp.]